MAEAMAHALAGSTARQAGLASLSELATGYLSDRHRADRATGCAVAALGADVARQSPALRRTLTTGVRRQIDRIASLLKRGAPAERRRRALASYAGMVGALVLARAVEDRALAREILATARTTFGVERD